MAAMKESIEDFWKLAVRICKFDSIIFDLLVNMNANTNSKCDDQSLVRNTSPENKSLALKIINT